MTRRSVALTVAILAAVAVLCGGMVGLPVMLFGQMQAEAAACELPSAPQASPVPGVGEWTSAQTTHATVIVSVGRQRRVAPRGYVIALAVAMQESTLRNLANSTVPESLNIPHDAVGSDHDSVGLFQQRPGWGSVRERMTPSYAARKFYEALVDVDGWQRMRLTDAAQAVQRSGTPEAYQKWEDDAEALAAQILGLPNIDDIGGGDPTAPCGADDLGPVPVGPGGWVQPIRATIVSPFGPRGGRLHAGVDLSRQDVRGDPIRAATSGVVEQVKCDWYTTCDRDGSTSQRGCGWYVDIRHPGDVVTRYCHMIRRPEVSIGQRVNAGTVIGFVGSSGGSSGPHLHFEVHVDVPEGPYHANGANAVDPVAWMRDRGAPLGPGA
ncbi:Murein DD-endopeptidase MepM and murein hydrolase activator NlpD, contain LysM domain [Micromonospora haikouensis]|uniref:Murein DD-endopeptidase MepM and murein hydrolase activator NlpD, contain LysM domain n=1 Tax=Micromonospora haikouensis TaxID=686309 RepID=A0A1C4YQ99_9ACTN|nr:M23 family metallopeptidase [Micromonospora haikouensis]SCF22511.1 Murein DD-endopeptidase MepM and murein hydrolase activator NlpD, contain LysM domain [Micromonospora haikouensis]